MPVSLKSSICKLVLDKGIMNIKEISCCGNQNNKMSCDLLIGFLNYKREREKDFCGMSITRGLIFCLIFCREHFCHLKFSISYRLLVLSFLPTGYWKKVTIPLKFCVAFIL